MRHESARIDDLLRRISEQAVYNKQLQKGLTDAMDMAYMTAEEASGKEIFGNILRAMIRRNRQVDFDEQTLKESRIPRPREVHLPDIGAKLLRSPGSEIPVWPQWAPHPGWVRPPVQRASFLPRLWYGGIQGLIFDGERWRMPYPAEKWDLLGRTEEQ